MTTDPKQSGLQIARMDSPIGQLIIVADEEGLTEIRFPNQGKAALPEVGDAVSKGQCNNRARSIIDLAIEQLDAYFRGHLQAFDLPMSPRGTNFQKTVWAELCKVKYGTTASYGEVAGAIGKPKAARAVGMANGRNPIPIVVPCHRIIGSDGSLTGFAGGLDTKRWLLAHERA